MHFIKKNKKKPLKRKRFQEVGCGGRIWTYDLQVMSLTSYQAALPRDQKTKDMSKYQQLQWLFLVAEEGFEPPTHGLWFHRSNQLSYSAIKKYCFILY